MAKVVHEDAAAEFSHVCDVEGEATARPLNHRIVFAAKYFVKLTWKSL